MSGKAKCKALKEIRKQIALENDIEYAVTECKYQGECSGTCPKCEEDLKYLERELQKRQAVGKGVLIAGISIGALAAVGLHVTKECLKMYQISTPGMIDFDLDEDILNEK